MRTMGIGAVIGGVVGGHFDACFIKTRKCPLPRTQTLPPPLHYLLILLYQYWILRQPRSPQ